MGQFDRGHLLLREPLVPGASELVAIGEPFGETHDLVEAQLLVTVGLARESNRFSGSLLEERVRDAFGFAGAFMRQAGLFLEAGVSVLLVVVDEASKRVGELALGLAFKHGQVTH